MNRQFTSRAGAAVGSLLGYWLAKSQDKESWYPYVALGGLIGMTVAEFITHKTNPKSCKHCKESKTESSKSS